MKIYNKILLLITLLLLTGCMGTYIIPPKGEILDEYIPEIKELRQIEKISYDRYNFDCKYKSVKYHNHLQSKGIKSRVVTGVVKHHGFHAWVEVYNPKSDKWHMIDPTWTGSWYDREGYEIKSYKQRKRWFIYKDNVTVVDIKNGDNFEKVFWKNLPPPFKIYFTLKGKKH